MKNQIVIDGITYVPQGSQKLVKAPSLKGKEYCIVRTYSAGVFAGFIDRKVKGKENTLTNSRRIWYWEGAASLSQLANQGVKSPDKCKFAQIVLEVDLKEIIEVIPCTTKAKESIQGVPVWEK